MRCDGGSGGGGKGEVGLYVQEVVAMVMDGRWMVCIGIWM